MSGLALELEAFVQPLEVAAESLPATVNLLRELGWDLQAAEDDWPAIRAALSFMGHADELANAAAELGAATSDAAALQAAADMLEILVPMLSDLGKQASSPPSLSPFDSTEFWSDLGEDLFGLLAYRYLSQYRPGLAGLLEFVGVLSSEQAARDVAFVRRRLHAERIPRILTDFRGLIVDKYHWNNEGDQPFDARGFLQGIRALGVGLGARPSFGGVPTSILDAYYSANSTYRPSAIALSLALQTILIGDAGVGGLWLVAAPIPPNAQNDGRPAGLVLFPVVRGSAGATFELAHNLSAQITGGFASEGAVRLEILPGSVNASFAQDLGASIDTSVKLTFGERAPTILFGSAGGSRMQIQSAGLEARVNGPIASPDIGVHLDVTQGKVVIGGGSGDGFLQKLLPPGGIQGEFELGVDWSRTNGVHLRGSASLEVTIPIHQTFADTIDLDSIYLGAAFENDALDAKVGVTGGAKLGPIAVSVERIGVLARFTFPETGGNLGKLNIDVGFLPPTGAGLAVNAGGITGGGFVAHDEDLGRYAGILNLKFSEIGLVAVALITTKLPGGKQGYALFINIGVTFSPPITLPYNFTLQGCGGLLALNRTMDVEALRSGLRQKTLDSILFPADPILNAAKIISDSERVFPIEEGRFVVGPMAKLGWGTGGVITANIAVIIELPAPIIIAVLGQIKGRFPKPDQAKVTLNLDVLGILDVAKEQLSIDATLYDSTIVKYALSGDMALRLEWGSTPVFAMSLGGFHPKFTPPPGFPSLRRLTLQLSSSSSFDLSATAYQALTSNTLQFGAHLDLHAEACGATVDGHVGMDTLICWDPFEFEVDIGGSLSAKYKGHHIASVHLSMDLSGPNPWHAKGKAKVSVLCWDVTAHFNKTWGDDEKARLPSIDPLEKFIAEVALASNWHSALLPRCTAVESLTTIDGDLTYTDADGQEQPVILVHPAGTLEVRERLLPLDLELELFANAEVTGHSKFDFALSLGAEQLDGDAPGNNTIEVKEHFARGQFKDLDKSERLSKASYERFRAGWRAGPDLARLDGAVQACDLQFESSATLADGTHIEPSCAAPAPNWSRMKRTLTIASMRWSALRHRGLNTFKTPGDPRVTSRDDGYTIVHADTLTRAVEVLPAEAQALTQTQAEDQLAAAVSVNPVLAGTLLVVPACEEEAA